MNFELNSEQALFQSSLQRFLADRRSADDGDGIWGGLAELGVLAAPFPEDLGGLGGSQIETMLIMSELGRALVPTLFLSAIVQAGALLAAAPKGHAHLPALMSGEQIMVLAHGEAAGALPEAIATRAIRDGGGYRLSGTKILVEGAKEADAVLITARPGDGTFDGLGLFLLKRSELAGRAHAYRTIDGYSASDLALEQLWIGEDALIASDCGDAVSLAIDSAIMAICAEAVGIMDAALTTTNDYLKTRRQFGLPIGSFQALQHRMADMYVDLEQSRSMLLRGTGMLQAESGDRTKAVSAAKALIGRLGKSLGANAVQLHGGIGVSDEHVVGRYFRRLVAIELQFGNSDFHLSRFAGASRRHNHG